MNTSIKPITEADRKWIKKILEEYWESIEIVSLGKMYKADTLPGFIATVDNKKAGLVTYHIQNDSLEIITLNSLIEGVGIATLLIKKIKYTAITNHCKRIIVTTTNANSHAQKFYEKKGFILKEIHKDAIEKARVLKPQIPLAEKNGILIKDEFEFEILF